MLLALRSLWQAKAVATVATAVLAASCHPTTAPTLDRGEYLPDTTTAIVSAVIRPTAPDALGDADETTAKQFILNPGAPGGSGTAYVEAPVMNDAPPGSIGAIEYVVAYARGAWLYPGPAVLEVDTPAFRWTVDGDTATVAADVPFAILGPEFSGLWWQHLSTMKSGNVAAQPNGNEWTWAAVNALADVRAMNGFLVGSFGIADMRVGEVWFEVYGEGGGAPLRVIRFSLAMGLEPVRLTVGAPRVTLPMPGPSFRVHV